MRISDWSSDVCSSDLHELPVWAERLEAYVAELADHLGGGQLPGGDLRARAPAGGLGRLHPQSREPGDPHRSEEHTSELQSLMRSSYAVLCLKKNKADKLGHNGRSQD